MCSVVGIKDLSRILMGASYDFYYGHGRLFVNKKGVKKIGLAQREPYFKWTSLYGSVTLNQFGRELPTGGMNEAGLSIHLLEQRDGGYAEPSENHLNEIQWIQYYLDCFSSVDEVVEHLSDVTIENSFFKVHYALCDQQGNMAFVDFIDGRAQASVVKQGQPLVITNDSYPFALQKLAEFGNRKTPMDNSSISRFIRLVRFAQQPNTPVTETDVFTLLDLVFRQPNWRAAIKWFLFRQPPVTSFWNTVFDPASRKVYWRTSGCKTVRYVDLTSLDFTHATPVLTLDVNLPCSGEVNGLLKPATRSDNQELIQKSYAPLAHLVSAEDQKLLVEYPETFSFVNQESL